MRAHEKIRAIGVVVLALLAHATLRAQEDRISAGILGGGTLGISEGPASVPSWGLRGFARMPVIDALTLDLGVGFMSFRDGDDADHLSDVETIVFPFDLRANVMPLESAAIAPYLFLGIGVGLFDVVEIPPAATVPFDESGAAILFPLGIGLHASLSDNLALDLQVGNYLSTSDDINPIRDGGDDVMWTAFAGMTWVFSAARDDVVAVPSDDIERDADNDGLPDQLERSTYGTDPANPDTDGDGLTDGDEARRRSTNPMEKDTDGDELPDGAEVNTHGTNPLLKDSDGDGLTDGAEVLRITSGPNNSDTDDDGMGDGDELSRGRDPLRPDGPIEGGEERYGFEKITFDGSTSKLVPAADEGLVKALSLLESRPDICVEIQGYADDASTREANLRLSRERARAVQAWLVGRGVRATRLRASGYGADRPKRMIGADGDATPVSTIELRVISCP